MKKSKKILKIVIVMLLLLLVGLTINNQVLAWDMHLEDYQNSNGGRAGHTITSIVGSIIAVTSTIGAGVAIIMLMVMGILYVTRGAEGKAEVKKDLTGYITGAIILFGASGILKLLQMFFDANLNQI